MTHADRPLTDLAPPGAPAPTPFRLVVLPAGSAPDAPGWKDGPAYTLEMFPLGAHAGEMRGVLGSWRDRLPGRVVALEYLRPRTVGPGARWVRYAWCGESIRLAAVALEAAERAARFARLVAERERERARRRQSGRRQ